MSAPSPIGGDPVQHRRVRQQPGRRVFARPGRRQARPHRVEAAVVSRVITGKRCRASGMSGSRVHTDGARSKASGGTIAHPRTTAVLLVVPRRPAPHRCACPVRLPTSATGVISAPTEHRRHIAETERGGDTDDDVGGRRRRCRRRTTGASTPDVSSATTHRPLGLRRPRGRSPCAPNCAPPTPTGSAGYRRLR